MLQQTSKLVPQICLQFSLISNKQLLPQFDVQLHPKSWRNDWCPAQIVRMYPPQVCHRRNAREDDRRGSPSETCQIDHSVTGNQTVWGRCWLSMLIMDPEFFLSFPHSRFIPVSHWKITSALVKHPCHAVIRFCLQQKAARASWNKTSTKSVIHPKGKGSRCSMSHFVPMTIQGFSRFKGSNANASCSLVMENSFHISWIQIMYGHIWLYIMFKNIWTGAGSSASTGAAAPISCRSISTSSRTSARQQHRTTAQSRFETVADQFIFCAVLCHILLI